MRCIQQHSPNVVCGLCYSSTMTEYRATPEYNQAKLTVDQIRKAIHSYDDGLLTPGDVIAIVAVALNDWAESNG